jgi:hypothetical protein
MRRCLRCVLFCVFALPGPLACAQNLSEQYLLSAANQDRAVHGLPALRLNEHLGLAAHIHAYEMAKRGTISHQFSGEQDLAARAADSGAHFSLITENVAEASNAALIHDLWMGSEGHRANLLDPKVDAVGIAVVQDHGQLYAVEDFGRTVSTLSLSQQESAVGMTLGQAGLSVLPDAEDARETCQMVSGHAGLRQPWFVMRYTATDIHKLPPALLDRIASGKYGHASVGACVPNSSPFTSYRLAVLLYP